MIEKPTDLAMFDAVHEKVPNIQNGVISTVEPKTL